MTLLLSSLYENITELINVVQFAHAFLNKLDSSKVAPQRTSAHHCALLCTTLHHSAPLYTTQYYCAPLCTTVQTFLHSGANIFVGKSAVLHFQEGPALLSYRRKPVTCSIKFTLSFLRHRTDQRRYLWRASIDVYLALYDGVNTTS